MATKPQDKPVDGEITHSNAPIGAAGGLDVAPQYDPQREAIERAARLDWERRQHPGEYVALGNGQAVRVQPGVMFKYPGENATRVMSSPEMILKDEYRKGPWTTESGKVVGPRYQWRVRTETSKEQRRDLTTQRDHRRGWIRYVEWYEVDPRSDAAIIEKYETANNEYVIWNSMILCEIINPELAYSTYSGWEDMAINRVRSAPQDLMSSAAMQGENGPLTTQIPGKAGVKVDLYGHNPQKGG